MKASPELLNVYTEGLPKTGHPGAPRRLLVEPVEFESTSGGIYVPTQTHSLLFSIISVGSGVSHPHAIPGNYCVPLLPALSTVDTQANFHSVLEDDVLIYYTPEQLTKTESDQPASLTAGEARRLGIEVPIDMKNHEVFTTAEGVSL